MAQPDDALALLVARLYDTAFDRYPDLDGAAISAAGDLNGDGLGDLLVSGGAYLANDAGATCLIYGSASWRT